MAMGIAGEVTRAAVRQAAKKTPPAKPGVTWEQRKDDKAAAEAAAELAALEEAAAEKLADRLDEAAETVHRHVWVTDGQADAVALLAAVSNIMETQVSLPRVLVTSDKPKSGKSVLMRVGTALSYDVVDVAGTWFDTKSAIFAAATSGLPCPVFRRDEISDVFGRSGLNGAGNPIGELLRRGYVAGETIGRSESQTSSKASIFSIFWMTGLQVAVPYDIRTRSIVIPMQPKPQDVQIEYFDLRDAMAEARGLAEALRHAVRGNLDQISEFRVRRDVKHRLLDDRNAEIWESLFAVANAAGQDWLNRCMAAFIELATDEADEQKLSPREELIRDLARAAAKRADEGIEHAQGTLMRSAVLRDELRHMDVRYAPLRDAELGRRITAAIGPVSEAHIEGRTARGWYAADIEAAWDRVRPAPTPDVALAMEDDPTSDDWDD